VGQYYKIQLAYKNQGDIGYLSTVGIAKYAATPEPIELTCDISGLCASKYTIPDTDPLEKIYSYRFDLFNSDHELKASTGIVLHNTDTDMGKE
jgi:hypothetical protein